jgi:drug/metabolite transporter (DMT)-like permease
MIAMLSWGVWAVMSKLMGEALSAAHSQALSTIGLLPVILALAFSRNLSNAANRFRGIGCALAGGTLACLGNLAYYDALNRGGKAATVASLTALYPFVTIVLALVLLKERLNRIQVFGLLLSLSAIYLFNVQREQGFASSWLAYALIPIALWGIAGFLQKLATNNISGELATLWFLAAFIPVAIVILWREPLPPHIVPKTWLLVGVLGLCFAFGNFAILAAFARDGKASIITPLTALYPVISVPIAIFVLGEKIGPREMTGILLALVSVTALSQETRSATSPATALD